MMYKLVITEKPAQGMSIAGVLGCRKHEDGYVIGNGYIVSWNLGHMAKLADAEFYDKKFAHWELGDLPIFPELWRYVVPAEKKEQFRILVTLMNREDVSEVINACDAGREGELIFREVFTLANCKKPMRRLWLSSLEEDAIREGFANLKDGADYDGLYDAALCRNKADWLVGINGTRLFSVLYHTTLKVGRVLSSTLALLVEREAQIAAFTPEPYYSVELDFNGMIANSEHMSREEAETLAADCGKAARIVSIVRSEKSETAPALFDLTTLQREANRRLGYTAQQTLDYLQSLYEKKLVTYPRTDSRYLTNDMEKLVPGMAEAAAKISDLPAPDSILAAKVCDSSKVTDHHAVVPTAAAAKHDMSDVPAGERDLLYLICLGVLRAVSGEYRYATSEIKAEAGGHSFTAKGKEILSPGWKYYKGADDAKTFPAVAEGAEYEIQAVTVKEGKTTPPKRMTEDTLLSAMENAGTAEEAERKGLGTPATRAGILEKLIASGYAERVKQKTRTYLVPTQLGKSLITVLPEALQSPLLTADWEHKLKAVERGELTPEAFLADIADMLFELVENCEAVEGAATLFPSEKEIVGKCPRCGGNVVAARKGYFCERQDCHFGLWLDNRFLSRWGITLTKPMAKSLLKTGQTKVSGLYSERTGKSYDAIMAIDDDGKQLRYNMVFGNTDE